MNDFSAEEEDDSSAAAKSGDMQPLRRTCFVLGKKFGAVEVSRHTLV